VRSRCASSKGAPVVVTTLSSPVDLFLSVDLLVQFRYGAERLASVGLRIAKASAREECATAYSEYADLLQEIRAKLKAVPTSKSNIIFH